MSYCTHCGIDSAKLKVMREVVEAAELLVDAADMEPWDKDRTAVCGAVLQQRVDSYRSVTKQANEKEGENEVQ